MKLKVFAVIDTNVLISFALHRKAFTHEIFKLIESKNITPLFDEMLLKEYYHVLSCDKFSFDKQAVYDILYFIADNGVLINDVQQTSEYFSDKNDIPFYEIINMDDKDYNFYLEIQDDSYSRMLFIPQLVLNTMGYLEKFVSIDWDYDGILEYIIKTQTSAVKYASGKDLLNDLFDDEAKAANQIS